jgi:hypothetical protein
MLDEQSKQRVKHLCELIAKEQDHSRFARLLTELNQVLAGNVSRRTDGSGNHSHVNVSDQEISQKDIPSSSSGSKGSS